MVFLVRFGENIFGKADINFVSENSLPMNILLMFLKQSEIYGGYFSRLPGLLQFTERTLIIKYLIHLTTIYGSLTKWHRLQR